MLEYDYRQIRCEDCGARLFDTRAEEVNEGEEQVEVLIRCWRCKRICAVHLAGPDAVAEAVLYSQQ